MSKVAHAKAEVKRRLAAKYERLARSSGSIPKRKTYLRHAERCRRQAQEILRNNP